MPHMPHMPHMPYMPHPRPLPTSLLQPSVFQLPSKKADKPRKIDEMLDKLKKWVVLGWRVACSSSAVQCPQQHWQ
jgi:hypothetical protein